MENKYREEYVIILQQHLGAIRKIAGWTTEELGSKIGVTKQTISNLENLKTPMTLTQYIAIRAILDYEIQTNTENTVLPQVVEILLNQHERHTKEERQKVSENVKAIAATAAGGLGGVALAAVAGRLIGFVPVIGSMVAGVTTAAWLVKLLKDKSK